MSDNNHRSNPNLLPRLLTALFSGPYLEILIEAWKLGKKMWRGLANEGMYEVLEYKATYELKDRQGKKAHFRKQQRIRYLQNNIISYQDQAWGDGDILINYRCSPGVEADRYRLGHKTYILISLRGMKEKGEVDEFNIEWDLHNSFVRSIEQCEAEISHRTKKLNLQVIFPKSRPPLNASVIESMRQKTRVLSQNAIRKLPDGRWRIKWELQKPTLYERYILKWEW